MKTFTDYTPEQITEILGTSIYLSKPMAESLANLLVLDPIPKPTDPKSLYIADLCNAFRPLIENGDDQ
jgi:hypothetical protein